MKKKLFWLAGVASVVVGLSSLTGCFLLGNKDEIEFDVDGQAVPQTVDAELGDLFILPKVSATFGDEILDVTIQVFDSTGAEVDLLNKKFKATDVNGYKIVFTAVKDGKTETTEIKVNVSDTKAPTFSVQGTSGAVSLLNDVIEVPSCLVMDASASSLEYTYSVKDPAGNPVEVVENKFTVTKAGDYVITYEAEDSSGNKGTKEFIVACKNAAILNNFEQASDIGWLACGGTGSVTTDNAIKGNAIKVSYDMEGYWGRICVPFVKEDGSYWTWKDLQKFEGIQLNVYSSTANEFGLAMSVKPIDAGKNIVYFSMEEIKASYMATPDQYEENGNGFYLNIRTVMPGTYIVLDYMLGIYANDYVPQPELTLEGYEEIPASFSVNMDETLTLPVASANRDGAAMDISVVVKDSAGNEVSLSDNSFAATDTKGYTIIYTLSDETGTAEIVIPVSVVDTRIPQILLTMTERMAMLGSTVQIPASEVFITTGETLTANVEVKDPEGNAVVVENNAFVATMLGDYTITYTTQSDLNGYTDEKTVLITVIEGEILNDFNDLSDIGWMPFEKTIEVYGNNDGCGLKVTASTSSSWARICLPLRNENGDFVSIEDLLEYEKLELYFYISSDTEAGLCHTVQPVYAGLNKLTFTIDDVKAGLAVDANQYTADANGFYFNVKAVRPGDVIIFENFVGVYADDYVPSVKASMEGYDAIPEEIKAVEGESFVVPTLTAIRDGAAMAVSVAVLDSNGNEVNLDGNAFTTVVGEYTIVYTLSDGYGEEEIVINLTVREKDTHFFSIEVAQTERLASVNTAFAIPAYEVSATTGETLTATVVVKAPDGSQAEVEGATYTPTMTGVYTICYTIASEMVDGGASAEITYTVVKGTIVNNFNSTADIGWVNVENTKEIVAGETGYGLKFTATGTGAWGRICIPFKNANGSFVTWEALQQNVSVDMYFYASKDMSVGLCNLPVAATKGFNKVTFTMAEILAAYAVDANQYSANENGFYITYNSLVPGDYIVFEYFVINQPKVMVENGAILSDFTKTTDLGWIQYTNSKELTEDGLKVTATGEATANWCRVCVPFRKADGSFYTWAEVQEFTKIELTVICPTYNEIGLTNNVYAAPAGQTTITFTAADILAGYAAAPEQYEENENGFFINVKNAVPGEYITFVSMVGYYPENVEEGGDVEEDTTKVALTDFAQTSDLGWVQYTSSKEVTEQGLKLTATGEATANWARVCVPCTKADGSFYTWEEIKQFARIELTVICPAYNEIGLTNKVYAAFEGETTITFTAEDILAAYEASADQYSANENGFFINVRNAVPGEYIIFVSMVGYYA